MLYLAEVHKWEDKTATRKIENDAKNSKSIETVWGIVYRLNG